MHHSFLYWFFSNFYFLKILLVYYINVKEKEFLEIENNKLNNNKEIWFLISSLGVPPEVMVS